MRSKNMELKSGLKSFYQIEKVSISKKLKNNSSSEETKLIRKWKVIIGVSIFLKIALFSIDSSNNFKISKYEEDVKEQLSESKQSKLCSKNHAESYRRFFLARRKAELVLV